MVRDPDPSDATPTDAVTANEWRAIFTDPDFLERLRRMVLLPRTEIAPGYFLVYREVGGTEVRYSRVLPHAPELGLSATDDLYADIPELYADPVLFLIEAHSTMHAPPLPTFEDLHGLLSLVSAKGFTQMPLGLWGHQPTETDAIALFLAQWRGYPDLEQWEAVEAVYAAPPTDPDGLAAALEATGILRSAVGSLPADPAAEWPDLALAERFAYAVHTFGMRGGGYGDIDT